MKTTFKKFFMKKNEQHKKRSVGFTLQVGVFVYLQDLGMLI